MTRRLVLATTFLALVAAGAVAHPAAAATAAGAVSFADGGGATTSGGSGAVSMGVPAGSACQGGGSSGYRWETFLVSSDVDLATVTFSAGPDPISGSFVAPLFDLNGEQISTKFPSSSPLGLISGIPAISLGNTVAGFGLTGLPLGTYRIGIACTYQMAVQEYWSATIEVTADAADTPLGIAWTVVDGSTTTTTTSTTVADSTSTSLVGGDTSTSVVTETTDAAVDVTSSTSVESAASGPVTGSSSTALVVLAAMAVLVGRAVVLSARRVKVLPPA